MVELPRTADFVVVGGGVVGLTIALELRRRQPDAAIVVLEKEPRAGEHQSGRNSGVLHAGFYYAADSLKARLCRDGNRRMQTWCDEQGIAVRRCGKLVVARIEAEHARLDELASRARANGVRLEPVDEADACRIEPLARTVGRALWSPTTAVVDPRRVMERLAETARDAGILVATGAAWSGRRGATVHTPRGDVDAGYLVNAAGLHADRIARSYGFADGLTIFPVTGRYLLGNADAPALRTLVYPVPDLGMPFLGVHLTVTAHAGVKIGPTAFPAPWREAYGLERFSAADLAGNLAVAARLFAASAAFRRHAAGELGKIRRRKLVQHAARLVPGLDAAAFDRWGPPGIRAQLVDLRRRELVMDFHHEGDDRSLHVLNAVSPAFTCAFAFAEHVANAIPGRV
jgi:(S)-2-hydroxyglutarate dehydrogenase